MIEEAGRVPVERDTLYREVIRASGSKWQTGRKLVTIADVVDATEVVASVAAIETVSRQGALLPMPWLSEEELVAARRMRPT